MYDPKNDISMKCACNKSDEDEYKDHGGWDKYFNDVLVPEAAASAMAEATEHGCPRSMVRHAIARLSVAMAMVSHRDNESESCQSFETMLADVPEMLRSMIEDARVALHSDSERGQRGAAAGFRRLN